MVDEKVLVTRCKLGKLSRLRGEWEKTFASMLPHFLAMILVSCFAFHVSLTWSEDLHSPQENGMGKLDFLLLNPNISLAPFCFYIYLRSLVESEGCAVYGQ